MSKDCIFCDLATDLKRPHFIYADELTMAFIDLRQFNPGHTLVMPRRHLSDVRELDFVTGAALMSTVSRITRAVSQAFPNEGISLWHSIGPAAFQEVPHLHIHVHPRRVDDQVLRVYPSNPSTPDWNVLRQYADMVRAYMPASSA
ncbi:MAG: HIT domain-containing protein [Phycisphaeraceae bacterium]|nr:HIT domain-containing protein [Phycisphaeraceae bacterium]